MHHGGADRRAMAAVALVNILNNLFAPLVFEIDIDIGRLTAIFRNEAGEQEIALVRIDGSNPEAKANRAIGRRTASLAQNFLLLGAREGNDIVHGEEVARIIEFADQREFVFEALADIAGNAIGIFVFWIAVLRARPCEIFQMLLRGLA